MLGTATADIVVRVDRFPAPGEGPLGDDAMARALEVAIQRYGITTARCFQVSAPSPRTLILLDPVGSGRFSALTRTSPRRHTP